MGYDRKYKGNTSAFDAAVKKKYPDEYKTAVVQDIIKKHAEMNEKLDDEDETTVKKVIGKLKKASQAHADQAKTLTKDLQDNYDIGNDYAKHTLRVTPGQSESDVDEMLGIMQKKSVSMREALAKVWGLDEGKSRIDKKEEKKEDKNSKKTMTGKEPTSVEVDPELKP